MRDQSANRVGVIATRAEYWNEFTYQGRRLQLGDIQDKKIFFQELESIWRKLYEVIVPGGFFALNWGDIPVGFRIYNYVREVSLAPEMIKTAENAGFYLIGRWIWRKFDAPGAMRRAKIMLYSQVTKSIPRAVANWEYIFVFKRPGRWRPSRWDFTDTEWLEYADGVWNIPYDEHDPACFPLELPKRLIKLYTEPGNRVIDPFGGRGTTLRAAFELKRSCTIIEVDRSRIPRIREYCRWGQSGIGDQIEWRWHEVD